MNTAKKKYKILAGVLALALVFILGAGAPAISARAASGNVYTCTVVPCYRHPVTGVIEDSGGEASYATGQGMVDGAVYTTGIMEVADDGSYYLTVRLSLADYTSNHSFWVQNVGDSGWSAPAIGVTGQGSDTNGSTIDVCMQVPSENCVVRGSMYVDPMGREVVFYLYPTNYTEGNSTDMNATMVTQGAAPEESASAAAAPQAAAVSVPAAPEANASIGSTGGAQPAEKKEEKKAAPELNSTLKEQPAQETMPQTDTTLDKAQGLSLSTQENDEKTASGSMGAAQMTFVITFSIVIAGLILLAAGAGIVYYFRRNWNRWGGGEDDDEDEE